jgi:AcrR family transcriptional regulator
MRTAKKARREDDKAARRRVLLAAAEALFGKTPYADITMAAVAKRAKLAKGTVYLYFASKEELFLALHVSLLDAWFSDVDARLDAWQGALSPESLIVVLASSLQGREKLVELLTLVAVLESGLGIDAARDHKRHLWTRLTTTGAKLEARFPGLGAGAGFRLLMHIWALIVGMHQLAAPSRVISRATKELGLAEFEFDFFTELAFVLHHLLKGLGTAVLT